MRRSPVSAADGYASITLNRRALFGVLGGATMGLFGACAERIRPYRYRMTVEVETPQGLRSGSSVMEVGGYINSQFAPGEARGRSVRSVTGEAICVEMPGEKMLFALMVSDRDANYMANAAVTAAVNESWYRQKLSRQERQLRQDRFLSEPRAIPRLYRRTPSKIGLFDNYPIFVTFGNRNDPQSLKRVDPDNLSQTFGDGVRLKRISVQLTDHPVTHQIQRYLPWIDRAQEFNFPPEFAAQNQTFGDYRRFFIMKGE
jgi:hypothetical protein